MNPLILPAPAKINIGLKITGKRDDGYHDLATIFQFTDLCDYLQFRLLAEPEIVLENDLGIRLENNLIYRAAKILLDRYQVKQGIQISVRKNIPIGGGLGGGSSDAATTLLALNYLWHLALTEAELCLLGLELGSDVPIFIHGLAAYATGRGEQFSDVELEEPWLLLIKPDCQASTREIFSRFHLTEQPQISKICSSLQGDESNDLEPIACELYPEIAAALDWLGLYGKAVMTGSGSCVYAAFASLDQAKQLQKQVPLPMIGYIAKACNMSPCHRILKEYTG